MKWDLPMAIRYERQVYVSWEENMLLRAQGGINNT